MDLVEALKQLSLEVRCHISSDKTLEQQVQDYNSSSVDNSSDVTTATAIAATSRLKQIKDLDHSIETLLVQLSDMEQPEQTQVDTEPTRAPYQNRSQPLPETSLRNRQLAYSKSGFSASLETSQEEDSDCSSSTQQSSATSSCNRLENSFVNPLLGNLLKRDLIDMTSAVRKLGHILAIGSEVAMIAKLKDPNPYIAQHDYASSLCDKFNSLYSSESFMNDLPTLRFYSRLCQQLSDRLFEQRRSCDLNVDMLTDAEADSKSHIVEDFDGDFLNDESKVENWTENRLYVGAEQLKDPARFFKSTIR